MRGGHTGVMDGIRISSNLLVPEHELEERFARSGGPGGQHVNTSSTKVELRWDIAASDALDDDVRDRVMAHLSSRLTDDGVLIIQASEHRSRERNREAARGRLANLLAEALRPQRRRRPTRPSRSSVRRGAQTKQRRSETKALRRRPVS